MAVSSSYSLGIAPCPSGSGWRRAALAGASPAPSPDGFAVAAVPVAAPSLQVPAAASWPGAPAEAKSAHQQKDTFNCKSLATSDKFCRSLCFALMGHFDIFLLLCC